VKVRYNSVQLNKCAEFIFEHNKFLYLAGERSWLAVRSAILDHMRDVAGRFGTDSQTSWSATGGWILVFAYESNKKDVVECEIFVDPAVGVESSYCSDAFVLTDQ